MEFFYFQTLEALSHGTLENWPFGIKTLGTRLDLEVTFRGHLIQSSTQRRPPLCRPPGHQGLTLQPPVGTSGFSPVTGLLTILWL